MKHATDLEARVDRTIADALDSIPYPLTNGSRAALYRAIAYPSSLTYEAARDITLTPPTDRRDGLTLHDLVAFDNHADPLNPGWLHILDAIRVSAERTRRTLTERSTNV